MGDFASSPVREVPARLKQFQNAVTELGKILGPNVRVIQRRPLLRGGGEGKKKKKKSMESNVYIVDRLLPAGALWRMWRAAGYVLWR